ncbi:MAG TPA: putative Ig domain-containing protein [Acidimicrobiales bacterium]|jgi:hypothetical protein|nr:putative Ig domain-containing protein [Acidimicrobiales bacterium]
MATAIGRYLGAGRHHGGGARRRRAAPRRGWSARLTALVSASCLALAGIQATIQLVGAGSASAAGPANGQIAVTAGDTGNGLGTNIAQQPYGLAVASDGGVYVSDFSDPGAFSPGAGNTDGDSVIRRLDPSTGNEQTVAGDGASNLGVHINPSVDSLHGALYDPTGMSIDPTNGSLVFDEPWLGVVARYTPPSGPGAGSLAQVTSNQSGGVGDGGDAAVDSYGDVVYPEFSGSDVKVYANHTGTLWGVSLTAGSVSKINIPHDDPWAVAIDQSNNLIVSDAADSIDVLPAVTGSFYGQSMTAGIFTRIAGNGACCMSAYGGDNGPAISALVGSPHGLSVDSHGNLLIADTFNNRVRVIAGSSGMFYGINMTYGDIYSVAGSGGLGLFGGDGGVATSALLNGPTAVVADKSGNLVISDIGNRRVRVVAGSTGTFYGQSMTQGDIYTVAGNGWMSYSGDGGSETAAQLGIPEDVSFDANGNELIADSGNGRIRVVASSSGPAYGQAMTAGDIYTVAGGGGGGDGGPATSASLNSPGSVRSDANGNLLIADTQENRIRVVAETTASFYGQPMSVGDIYTIAGTGTSGSSGDSGAGTAAELNAPQTAILDGSGNVVIADSGNNRVRVLAEHTGTFYGQSMSAGDIYTIAGTGAGGFNGDASPATTAELNDPIGLALDPRGNVLVADSKNGRVRVLFAQGGTDFGSTQSAGAIVTIMGGGGAFTQGVAPLSLGLTPDRLTVDARGDVIVSDDELDSVYVLPAISGTFWGQSMTAGTAYYVGGHTSGCSSYTPSGAATSADLCQPAGVSVDPSGDIAVASPEINRVFAIGNVLGVTTTSLPGGFVSQSYGPTSLNAAGGPTPFTWSVGAGALPPGLNLASDGTISGTPTGGGTFDFTVQATDSDSPPQSVSAPLSITVQGLTINSTTPNEGFVNAAYSSPALTASNGYSPLSWSVISGATPPGINLNADGSWSGTPTAQGTYSFTVQVTDSDPAGAQTATAPFSIQVEPYATSIINTAAGVQSASGITATTTTGSSPTSTAVGQPDAVTVDSYGNTIFTDTFNSQVDVVAGSTGTFYGISMTAGQVYLLVGGGPSTTLGGPAATFGLSTPVGVTIDKAGNLVIADAGLERVFVVANSGGPDFGQSMAAGDIYAVAGSGAFGFSGTSGPATSAEFEYPSGVAVDAAGNLLITDALNNTVWIVANRTGTFYGTDLATADDIYTIVDSGGAPGDTGDGGSASAATVNLPLDVAVDAAGNAVIADYSNNAIRVVANTPNSRYGTSMSAGDIYTIAGTGPSNAGFGGDGGPATSAELNGPQGVGFDSLGDLYVADTSNNRIRMIPSSSATYYGIPMTAGDMYTVAGDGIAGYSGDTGPSGLAELDAPSAVALAPNGTLMIADFSNFVLRAVASGTPPTVTAVNPNHGPPAGGNTVTLTGTGFVSGSTTADFGSTAGTGVSVSSATSLTVVVPAGTGTVPVTVTTTSGGSSTPLANAYTYNTSTAGGAITLGKTTDLIGNYPEKVSGTGWTHDTTVTLNECATPAYGSNTCDAANKVSVTLGTGRTAGTFKNDLIHLAVGAIDTNGDTCGVAGSTTCYVVVVGNQSGDSTASAALGFSAPRFVVKRTAEVLGNYADPLKAGGFPIGDTVLVQECDASVSVPSTDSTNCDAATQVTGTASATGGVIFSPGVTLRAGSGYADSAAGTCTAGGTCDIVVTDEQNPAIGLQTSVTFATPLAILKKTVGVAANYVDNVKAGNFPIGDTVTAQECDAGVTSANVATNCDSSTSISGTVAANGKVTFNAAGVKILVGSAYSDTAGGMCNPGGTCDVVVNDSTQSGFYVAASVGLAG